MVTSGTKGHANRTILLTGGTGQVGWELQRTLATLGTVIAPGRDRLDLMRPETLVRVMRELRPSIVINAAAYTAVDQAEDDASTAHAINAVAPGVLAEEARQSGALLVGYSTDYVYDGTKQEPYQEGDAKNPLSTYGRTKLAGDEAVIGSGCAYLIFRTSWVYGVRGRNFLLTMLRLGRERNELRVVDDQIGAPTWSRTIAEATAQVLSQAAMPGSGTVAERLEERSGVYHLTSGGQVSWFGFARAILEGVGLLDRRDGGHELVLRAIETSAYPTRARRPSNSMLSSAKLEAVFGIVMPEWTTSLAQVLEDETCMTRKPSFGRELPDVPAAAR